MAAASSSINPNTYNPIWDLEKQYAPPLGRRIALVIKLNNACLVPGGVDTVLKSERDIGTTSSAMDAAVQNSIAEDMKNMNVTDRGKGRDSPFHFLSDDASAGSSSFSSKSKSGRRDSFKLAGFGRGFGAKLKNQFERGVTNIAVQAQKATGDTTDIRDLLTVGAYIQNSQTGEFDVCLGMTERFEMPATLLEDPDAEGLTFRIPILIPPHVLDPDVVNGGAVIQFHLWMRSGAAIFTKSRALRKYLFVGSTTLPLAHLVQQIQPKFDQPFGMVLPLQSTVVTAGKMTMIALPDTKFPSLCGNGWSLSDPRTDTAYTSLHNKRILFNPPLDQNYSFPFSKNTVFTTERLTESTVVLPLAAAYTKLLADAAAKSTRHAMNIAAKLQCLDGADLINDPMKAMQEGHAQCQIEVLHFLRYQAEGDRAVGGNSVHVTLNLQRPDSIFENCLANCDIPSHLYIRNMTYPSHAALSFPFYPRIVGKNDPRLLPGLNTGAVGSERDVFVGKLRIQLYEESVGGAGGDVFSPIGPTSGVGTSPRHLEAVVDIDAYLNAAQDAGILYLNVIDLSTGGSAGTLAITINATTLEGMVERSTGIAGKSTNEIVDGGLISLVGMDTLMEDDTACHPYFDLHRVSADHLFKPNKNTASMRQRQLSTMGEFLTYDYTSRHAEVDRTSESTKFLEKSVRYLSTLNSPLGQGEESLPPDQQKEPRPFRPSSSRLNPLLAAIGFNIHIQSFSVSTIAMDTSTATLANIPTTLFQNVTCGAPADHSRGFSKKSGDGEKGFSGGLRRLEASRRVAATKLRDLQNQLIEAVGSYYTIQSQNRQIPGRSQRHIAAGDHQIASLRNICIAATQSLHSLTWDIAVRRGNVFSQALGIAMSLFLAHVSDLAKLQKAAWAEIWTKHGFLVTFEGLLSAAGKELGMIEDAAVGIAMLRMVSVVFVTENNQVNPNNVDRCFGIVDSPYLKWVRINPSGEGTQTRYLVEICVDVNYYAQRIPTALKNQTQVRFYPVLYQMGVDIRQWGANAGANFGKKSEVPEEMDEDEIGIPDNDVLIALNYEAFRKMNAFAHEVYLCNDPQGKVTVTWEQAHDSQQIEQPIHPMLTSLYEYIRASAGKMEHGILDEAGFASNRLGGGSAIFCKSGKDRTAMQVTFKQSQYINRFLNSQGNGFSECQVDSKKVFNDSTVMRVYGTRLPTCDKNVGQALYAFNSLQAKFMPEPLKPPARALAGFLKGGRLLAGGGIES
mmetsp:Transcript_17287/g.25857  ORF Transcript_17287/g.25857 Transcript_17287/m.25857 type:complete len:1239 (-) Transcript_17287:909-4625(-)